MPRAFLVGAVVLAFTGCVSVTQVAELQPRPNLPTVDAPPKIVILLDDFIAQEQTVDVNPSARVQLDTFRGDLKRGFLNGVPGAIKGTQGDATLQLETAEPSLTCFQFVGCTASIRFKGRLVSGADEYRFAGTSKSELCPQSFDACFVGAIERMYEQIFADVKLRSGRRTNGADTNEL